LRYHPRPTLDFFIRVFNHSANWYANPRFNSRLEPPWKIGIAFADGTTREHWGNPRFWNLYRGLSVGPCVLQSLLMALEGWLLEFAAGYPEQLDALLVDILRRSESAMLAAVVASVATAHTRTSGEALLVLLSAPDCIALDRGRTASEHPNLEIPGMYSRRAAENRIYQEERSKSNHLTHRRQSLEDAIIELQLGPLAPRVQAVLDRHRAVLPPVEQRDNDVRAWRLAIHRMDLRQYTPTRIEVPDSSETADDAPLAPPKHFLRLDPNEPDPDVRGLVEQSAARFTATNDRLRLFNWAYKTFKRETSPTYDPAMWQPLLLEAMTAQANHSGMFDVPPGGPGVLAAVCIRDQWEEMSDPQRDWCMKRACSEVMATADQWSSLERVQRFDLAADRACAWVLPSVLEKTPEGQRSYVQEALAAAVTHPITEVRWYAVWGVASCLPGADRALAKRCINALATEATLIMTELHAQEEVPYAQRRQADEIAQPAANAIRRAFWEPDGLASNAYETLDVNEWLGTAANAQILTILARNSDDPTAVAAFVRASQTLVSWWDGDDNRNQDQGRPERDHDSETALTECLQTFVMRTSYESAKLIIEPLLDAIDSHPREVHWIIQGLTGVEDRSPNTPHYWLLWELFAGRMKHASWVPGLGDDHPYGREVLSAIFLSSWWKDDVRHWRSLDGHARHVHVLFESLPPSWIVLDCYVRFLYHIGEKSLPEAFGRIANSLRAGDAQAMLTDANTIFLLEILLQRHVYGKPLALKRDHDIQQAVLYLLDLLVENGSAAAFRMRDDFVTPALV